MADPDDFIREGVGTLVTRFRPRTCRAAQNSPVTAIRYGAAIGGGVLVETAGGSIAGAGSW